MRLVNRRKRPDPVAEDLAVAVTIRWGMMTLVATTRRSAPRLWLHALWLDATAASRLGRTAIVDSHAFDLPVPVRIHPGGSIASHWRPRAFDLEDPALHRPVFVASAVISLPRRPGVTVDPEVSVLDAFTFDGSGYVLPPDSTLRRDDRRR